MPEPTLLGGAVIALGAHRALLYEGAGLLAAALVLAAFDPPRWVRDRLHVEPTPQGGI